MTREQWLAAKNNLAQRERLVVAKLEAIRRSGGDPTAPLVAELAEIQNTRRRLRRTIGSRGRFLAFSTSDPE